MKLGFALEIEPPTDWELTDPFKKIFMEKSKAFTVKAKRIC